MHPILRVATLALATLLAAGCLEPDTLTCETPKGAVLCAPGAVCIANGCAFPDELAACADKPDGAACTSHFADRGACSDGICLTLVCGDGRVAFGEACDDGNTLDGDGCSANCASNETCGNGTLDKGEVCDDGNLDDHDGCHADCRVPTCGDGIIDGQFGELCDDGNAQDGDGCSANCRSNERCGNGIVDLAVGELCDDQNTNAGDGCAADCKSAESCGNGVVDTLAGELCDDGNNANGDGCAANCRSNETCGNGVRDAGETCDDGNATNGDGCAANCASTEICGNGIIDAGAGEQCDDGNNANNDGCAGNCRSNETCGNGVVDVHKGEQCDDGANNGAGEGQTCRMTCKFAMCGDGIVDPGEICDDGNATTGDGCAFQCQSNETCGNNIVDFEIGEHCDSGIHGLSADGCASICRAEFPNWTDAKPAELPPLIGAAMVYDHHRERMILFGGRTEEGVTDQTWEFDGIVWMLRTPPVSPPGRVDHALAYDPVRRRVVLFGGSDASNTQRNDTWEYDGQEWQQIGVATSPSARSDMRLSYDGQEVIMYGGVMWDGIFEGTFLDDTWSFNGTRWTRRLATSPPGKRRAFAMAFDSQRTKVVLFGGYRDPGGYVRDTWEWNGATWTQRATTASPTGRLDHGMAYDSARNIIVLYGGIAEGGQPSGTWEFNGTAWTLANVNSLGGRYDHAMAFHAAMGTMLLAGGHDYTGYKNDSWTYQGGEWLALDPPRPPTNGFALTYDPLRGQAVLFGGYRDDDFFPDPRRETWVFDGVWRKVTTEGAPTAETSAAMVFDTHRRKVVLFGGYARDPINETWEYDGAMWQRMFPAVSPSARIDHRMVYDSKRRRVVLFGGYKYPTYHNDTWEYDGSTWVETTRSPRPSPRTGAGLAYDARAERVILFGGSHSGDGMQSTYYADTWEYRDNAWTQRTSVQVPVARTVGLFTYNQTMGLVVMHGGYSATGALTDTWEYDALGSGWRNRAPVQKPAVRAAAAYFDTRRSQVVTMGGYGPNGYDNDMWAYGWRNEEAPPDTCLHVYLDSDLDGRGGCGSTDVPADPDCWGRCTPTCPPWSQYTTSASTVPWPAACALLDQTAERCGDGTCDSPREDNAICPADCP